MNITLITGGQRSGKSIFAQQKAIELSENPIYIATARIWDQDFKHRVDRHRIDRGYQWQTIEKEKYISEIDFNGKVAVLDCITLWLTNFYADCNFNPEIALKEAQLEWTQLIRQNGIIFVVSNELGMGVHPESESARKFADMQGWMNQLIAKQSNTVYLMVSGIPVKIK